MEIPTARIMKENSFRAGASQVRPYRNYYAAISPFRRLEISGRVTEILGVASGLENQKYYKDKVIDLKFQFYPEGKYMPALALGIMDPHGSRIYPSQYVAASKQVYPFDFTLGFGNGRFGKKPLIAETENFELEILTDTMDWLKDSQFFWGVQFAPSEKFALMFEYSPIKYHEQTKDPAVGKYFSEPVRSKYNFGIRYKPTKWSEIDLSYQRGNQFGINLSMAFDIGTPLIPIYDHIYREQPAERFNHLHDRITRALHHSGFSDIAVSEINGELWIEAQNEQYFYNAKAIGIILEILNNISPENIHSIHIVLKENSIPLVELITTAEDIADLYKEKLTLGEFLYLSNFNTHAATGIKRKGAHRKDIRYGFKPSIETFLNDPSGFFKYRLGVTGWMSYHPWKGASFISAVATYPLNNMESANKPLSIPVRSDIVQYKEKDFILSRLMFDQIIKLTPGIYGKLSGGILEVQYAGIDAEVAMPVLDGRIFLGLSGSAVKKRDPDDPLRLKDNSVKDSYTTAFIKTRLNIPELEAAVDIKAGRFLAGDNGIRFTVYKNIKSIKLWAWYTVTDTSVFSDDYNDGYHDKGIGISIPLRLFKGADSRTSYSYSLSPWTRDTGQDIERYNTLFDFIGRSIKIYLDRDSKMMY